jgi:hypothetical protein
MNKLIKYISIYYNFLFNYKKIKKIFLKMEEHDSSNSGPDEYF